jgi:TetR/AcrR family transcriptional repressor of nem operon
MGPLPQLARQRRPEATREKLLQSAEELFLRNGYVPTSVDAICEKARCTKGAFFHHFESKDELAAATLDRFVVRRFSELVGGTLPSDPVERLEACVDNVIDTSLERGVYRGCLIGMLVMELGATNPALRERCNQYLRQFVDALTEVFQDAFCARSVRGQDPRIWADCFVSLFEGALLRSRATKSLDVFEDNLRHFKTQIVALLGASPLSKRNGSLRRARRERRTRAS